jgi:uncharacterized protein YeaO (DUF488 family)
LSEYEEKREAIFKQDNDTRR